MERNKFSLIGHSQRIFDLRFSNDALLAISGSEDGTAILWNTQKKKKISSFNHSKKAEVLRTAFFENAICTCGSNGVAIIWNKSLEQSSNYHQVHRLDHKEEQIYCCEPLSSAEMITASDNCIHFWDMNSHYSCKSVELESSK